MRYLRIALEPDVTDIHPLFPVFSDSEFVTRAQMLDWNVPPGIETSTVLFYVDGDKDRVAEKVVNLEITEHYDITPITRDEFYIYIKAETTDVERQIWQAVTIDSLLLMPPLQYTNGQVKMTLIGTHDDLKRAVEEIPDGIKTDVKRISEYNQRAESIASLLSGRQYEAVMAGIETGYYNVPREATKDDIAEKLGCSPSTASEHLRKAETRIILSLLGDQ